jgi:AraC family transcriptional activator of pobA
MSSQPFFRFNTITEYHRAAGLPGPAHPLVSVVRMDDVKHYLADKPYSVIFDFYSIALKRFKNTKLKYGQQTTDFDEGVLFFMSPGQVVGIEVEKGSVRNRPEGWMILIHTDFLWNTPLAKTIKKVRVLSLLRI